MTTNTVKTLANIGNIGSPDLDLDKILRHEVCPQFFADVGKVSWRRAVGSISVVANTRGYDLADDFGEMVQVSLGATSSVACKRPSYLDYIGEDPTRIINAELSTTPARPTAYYLGRRTTTLVFKKLFFDAIPDVAYPNCKYVYYTYIAFPDDTTDVELDKYVPSELQWGIVKLLTSKVYFNRYGEGDERYTAALNEYGGWLASASENKEKARRQTPKFAR